MYGSYRGGIPQGRGPQNFFYQGGATAGREAMSRDTQALQVHNPSEAHHWDQIGHDTHAEQYFTQGTAQAQPDWTTYADATDPNEFHYNEHFTYSHSYTGKQYHIDGYGDYSGMEHYTTEQSPYQYDYDPNGCY